MFIRIDKSLFLLIKGNKLNENTCCNASLFL